MTRHEQNIKFLAIGTGSLACAVTQQARALSIQDFFNKVSVDAQPAAVELALTTEAFRNREIGNYAQVSCLAEKLIPTEKGIQPKGFRDLHKALMDSQDPTTETVEFRILQFIQSLCPATNVEQGATFRPLPVREFFVWFEDRNASKTQNNINMIDALNVPLSTQALRVKDAGDQVQGQCIADEFTTRTVNGQPVFPAGLKELGKKVGLLHDSATESVEGQILGVMHATCGQEKTRPRE